MAIKSQERVAGCFAKAAEDEPLFVLRAQDKLAPIVIRLWAELAAFNGAGLEKVHEAKRLAFEMEQWPSRKFPD
jgi:hypothetical protein